MFLCALMGCTRVQSCEPPHCPSSGPAVPLNAPCCPPQSYPLAPLYCSSCWPRVPIATFTCTLVYIRVRTHEWQCYNFMHIPAPLTTALLETVRCSMHPLCTFLLPNAPHTCTLLTPVCVDIWHMGCMGYIWMIGWTSGHLETGRVKSGVYRAYGVCRELVYGYHFVWYGN